MPDLPWVLSPEQKAGLLITVVTGGRPLIKQRPTSQLLDSLVLSGFPAPLWVVSDRDAPQYERDGYDLAVYSHEWAYEYARDHWMNAEPPDPDARFYGAFPGREHACREAEARGCWGVMQLDDNILPQLRFLRGSGAGIHLIKENGNLGLYADVIGALSLATNARMLGAQLAAAIPSAKESNRVIRPGFPYSCFIEKVGEGREPWYGPYEDDITHAFQYGDRADGATAAVVPLLTYIKESKSKTGMRAKYDQTRAVALQRMVPQGATITIKSRKANGKGDARVFHHMNGGAIRNPVVVKDPVLYGAAKDRLVGLRSEWYVREMENNRAKVRKRTASYARKQEAGA